MQRMKHRSDARADDVPAITPEQTIFYVRYRKGLNSKGVAQVMGTKWHTSIMRHKNSQTLSISLKLITILII